MCFICFQAEQIRNVIEAFFIESDEVRIFQLFARTFIIYNIICSTVLTIDKCICCLMYFVTVECTARESN